MPNTDHKSKVSLEELLRLKRAEQPAPEFWAKFERELRQKQLTALVQKRRWWDSFPLLLSRRVYLPAGAAAAVAFTLVTVRYVAPLRIADTQSVSQQFASADLPLEVLPTTVVDGLDRAHVMTRLEPTVVATATGTPAAEIAETAELMPAMLAPRESESPSARSIAANLARLEQSEPELLQSVMGSRLSSPARVQAVASVQTDPELMGSSDSSRRYRLIARYADRALSPQPSAPALVRERIARRLGDDLVDGMGRVGVVGDRVSLKF